MKVNHRIQNKKGFLSMRIITQSAAASYFLFPSVPLLCAPRIAGLLPARAGGHTDAAPSFTFHDPRLAELSSVQRERLFDAARALLEIAVSFGVGTMNEDALRAAEVLFHRAAGGTSPARPTSPAAYKVEQDADLLAWYVDTAKHMAAARE